MFGFGKKKQRKTTQPTPKAATMDDKVVGGVETVTEYGGKGNVLSQKARKVTPEMLRDEDYKNLRWGFCCVCYSKTKPVDAYDTCGDCNQKPITDIATRFHIYQLFDLLHKEEIAAYEDSIREAYNETDADGLRILGQELKSLCFSYGTAGQVYIEDRVHNSRETQYSKGTNGYVFLQAFDWWQFNLQLTEPDFSFPPKI